MYMKRPNVPDAIHQTVKDEAREHENAWHQTLERILEQDANLEIKAKPEATA